MNEKELLLEEIEALISYGKEGSTIDPALLEYMDIDALKSIKSTLEKRVGVLSQEDKEWLEQFKKQN